MRSVATGAFIAMTFLFIVARSLVAQAGLWGYVAAFAEAAMVGALADWFAVVALFRHPLGIPVWHTAILPRNQERIGAVIARFVVAHFLTCQALDRRLRSIDFARVAAEWLWTHADKVARRLVEWAPQLLRGVGDEDLRRFFQTTVMERLRSTVVASLAGKVLTNLTDTGRVEGLVEQALELACSLLRENGTRTHHFVVTLPPLPPLLAFLRCIKEKVGQRIARQVIQGIEATLVTARTDPGHPLRQQIRAGIRDFGDALQRSPAYRHQGEEIKEELLRHPALTAHVWTIWADLRQRFLEDLAAEDSGVQEWLKQLLERLAIVVVGDRVLRDTLNRWLQAGILAGLEAHAAALEKFIRERVSLWDAEAMSQRLEEAVGRDLQFIRLNGTIVGGLVGLVLHGVSSLAW